MRETLEEELEKKLAYCRKLCMKYYERCFGSHVPSNGNGHPPSNGNGSVKKALGGGYRRTYETKYKKIKTNESGTSSDKSKSR